MDSNLPQQQFSFTDIMTKERVTAKKKTKTETITKPKNAISLGEVLPIFLQFQVWIRRILRFLRTTYSANQRDNRFSKPSQHMYEPKTKP